MMRELESHLLVDGLTYGEGPRWHDGALWFSDMHADAVRTLDPSGVLGLGAHAHHPSGIGWTPDGDLLVTTLHNAVLTRITSSGPQVYCDLSAQGLSLNDMVTTPDGLVYVDVYTEQGAGAPHGDIVLVTPEGEARVVAAGLLTPNGMAVTPDRSTLIASETFGHQLHAWSIEADGALSDHRVFADLGERSPDGLCLDAEGGVWVGCFLTGEFLRVVEGGEITDRVSTGKSWAVAPALGGPEMRTLYLVVNDTTFMGVATGDSKCRIEAVEVAVPGCGSP